MNIDAVPALDYHLHLNINGDILTANYIDADSTNGALTAAHNFNLSLHGTEYKSELNVHDSYSGNKTLTSEDRGFRRRKYNFKRCIS